MKISKIAGLVVGTALITAGILAPALYVAGFLAGASSLGGLSVAAGAVFWGVAGGIGCGGLTALATRAHGGLAMRSEISLIVGLSSLGATLGTVLHYSARQPRAVTPFNTAAVKEVRLQKAPLSAITYRVSKPKAFQA